MKYAFSAFWLFLSSSLVHAETVDLTDGRTVELRNDGTYEFVDAPTDNEIKIVIEEPYLLHHAGEYNRNQMRFMPVISNNTDKEIVGYRFKSRFLSAFGDEVFSFDGESSERITAGSKSNANTFYFFEDNQFISGEPYDKLKIFESNGTGRSETVVTAVVFSDGTSWTLTSE
ncbi:MAG: hypothetical protein ABJO29_05280 [Yoonia sp.]|uniref:hypothetical protein n=1 Tax=Yoonia sp. TaxID=2212373 RepID=UPI0032671C6B